MADRPARVSQKSGRREVIDYYFNITINVTSGVDEKRLRRLIDEELKKLAAAVASKTP